MRLRRLPRDQSALQEVGQELLTMEKEQYNREFKFGVIYAKGGQSSGDEFFGNGTKCPRG